MAFEESLRSVSLLADASLAGYTGVPGLPGSASPNDGEALFRFVKITGKRTVGLATTKATDVAIGVCQSKPQVTGQAATIGIRGITMLVVDAGAVDIAPGDPLTCDASGRGIKATGGDQVYAYAIEPATVTGELIAAILKG